MTTSQTRVPRFFTPLLLSGALLLGSLACTDDGGPAGTSTKSRGVGDRSTTVIEIVLRPDNFIGEKVLLKGWTLRQRDDKNEFDFTDETAVIAVEFKPNSIAALGEPIELIGRVEREDGGLEVNIIGWQSSGAPPEPKVTQVREILADPRAFFGSVVTVEGRTTRQRGNDRDEFFFSDDTGEIAMDFQSNNIAPLGTPIRVTGRVSSEDDSAEIDVSTWVELEQP